MIKKLSIPDFDNYSAIAVTALDYPREACGILLGKIENEIATITGVIKITNIAPDNGSFVLDPQEFHDALLKTTTLTPSAKQDFIGIFHTHPDFPGYPSTTDWRAALAGNVPRGLYLIYSYYHGTNANSLYSYEFDGEQFRILKTSYEKT